MFSNIGKIAGLPPRHAEETDTRQHIQRHDPDQHRRSEDESDEPKDPFAHEDSAIVTISALRLFLENFLKSLEPEPPKAQNTKAATPPPQTPPPAAAESAPKHNSAAKAAHAYQSASRAHAQAPQPPQMNEAEAKALLGAEDIRTIHTLIEDVKSLEKRGVEFLKIEKGESFLHSLTAAVKALKP